MYKTKTYIAGDWDHDRSAVQKLYEWNRDDNLGLTFHDAHEITQARDSSLNCSIKQSLAKRLDQSKIFVLIVGEKTNKLTAGSCKHCSSYDSYHGTCHRKKEISLKSYIDFECDKAVRDKLNVIVLYRGEFCNRNTCPESVRYIGYHIPMIKRIDGVRYWNYEQIKSALDRSNR